MRSRFCSRGYFGQNKIRLLHNDIQLISCFRPVFGSNGIACIFVKYIYLFTADRADGCAFRQSDGRLYYSNGEIVRQVDGDRPCAIIYGAIKLVLGIGHLIFQDAVAG